MTNRQPLYQEKAHTIMLHTQTPPLLIRYFLGQEREHLAHVELHSVATKEEVREKTWLNLESF